MEEPELGGAGPGGAPEPAGSSADELLKSVAGLRDGEGRWSARRGSRDG